MSAPAQPQSKPGIAESFRILFGASRGYWLVNSANFLDGVAYFGILTLLVPFLARDVGMNTNPATTAVGLFSGAVTIFMALGGGVVSDRLGVRRGLTLCIAILLVGRIILAISPTLGGAAAIAGASFSLLIMAAGEGIIQPALYSGIKVFTDRRTATIGFAFLYSIMNLGIVAGEIVSPMVREWWAARVENVDIHDQPGAGMTGAMWFFIGVTAVMLAINLFVFTRRVEERDRTVEEDPEPVGPAPVGLMAKLRNLPILDARFLFFIFILLPVRTLFAHQWLTIPEYIIRAFPSEVGARFEWISGLNPLVIVIFVPLIAMLTQKARVVDMMIVGTTVTALSTFLLVPGPHTGMLITYVILFSLGEAAWSSRFLEYIADIAPVARVGVYMGIAGIPWFLAKAVTGFYAGAMLDVFVPIDGVHRPGMLWLVYGLIALLSPIGLILARGWMNRGVHNEGIGSSSDQA